MGSLWTGVSIAVVVGALGCGDLREPSADVTTPQPDRAAAITMLAKPEHAPAWSIAYGEEFWREPGAEGERAVPGSMPGNVSIGDAIERVSHAIARDAERAMPATKTRTYTARFDGLGIRFSPHRPADHARSLAPVAFSVPSPVAAESAAELRLRTVRIAVGDRVIYTARDVPWSVIGNTAQALLVPESGIVEHYETRAAGVEVSWILPERPATEGDLVVEMALDGMAFAGLTDGGVHYADGDGTPRARVGQAVLVDARGSSWPVSVEPAGGALRYRVAAVALAQAQFPVVLDPVVSPEFGMDEPVIGNAPLEQLSPAVASNGVDHFAAWEDGRAGFGEVYGTRVSATGVVLDPNGIRLSTAASRPSVASNGTDYLVAWEDYRSSPRPDIFATRVTVAGVLADPAGIAVSTAPSEQSEPSVASNGTDYLVAWSDRRNGVDIYASRVTSTGIVVDPSGIAVSTTVGVQLAPSVASNGTDYLVAWEDKIDLVTPDIYASRVTAAGTVVDSAGIAVSTDPAAQRAPSVASNGADYLVAWDDERNNLRTDIYASRVTLAGAVADPAGIAVSTADNDQYDPTVASNGTDYLVAWEDRRNNVNTDVYATRVTSAGSITDPGGIALSTVEGDQHMPSIAFNGTDYFVAWADRHAFSTSYDIVAKRVSAAGVIKDANAIPLTLGPNRQNQPAVASSTSGFLVVWQDFRSGAAHLYATRLSASGAALDPNGITVSTAPDPAHPAVASNGEDYLVVWSDRRAGYGEIYATRVTATGVVTDSGLPIATTATSARASVASNGTNYLVAWSESQVYARRVTDTGIVADPGGITVSNAPLGYDPAVASNGTDYLVTWLQYGSADFRIHASRVTSSGIVLDPSGIAVSATPVRIDPPSVASNGADYLVAWQERRDFITNEDIYASRVTGAGIVMDPAGIAVSTAPASQGMPTVTSNGNDYLVAWDDLRGSYYDVYASRVTAAGTVKDPTGVPLSIESNRERFPRLAYNSVTGAYLVVYESFSRVRGRFIAFEDCGNGVLNSAETCDDGSVVDGDGCSASCVVEAGHSCTGTPSTCVDIDECALNNGGCAQVCTNTPGSFSCACDPGFTLDADGLACDDIDECVTNNGGCSTSPPVTCTNNPGSSNCGPCPVGFSGDGATCDDIDECTLGVADCAANASCTNTVGGFACACDAGNEGDGRTGRTCTDDGTEPDAGCGCHTADPAQASLLLVALALVLRRTRRRTDREPRARRR